MGFNFRKRIRLGKLLNLNVSKSGLSLSFGKKGIRQSINTKGTGRTTLSIPGTGLYYTKSFNAKPYLKKVGQKKLFGLQNSELLPEEEVQEFHQDLRVLMNLHQERDFENSVNWKEISHEEPPFKKGEKGPYEIQVEAQIKKNSGGIIERILNLGKRNPTHEKIRAKAKEEDLLLYKAYENLQIMAKKMNKGTKEEFLLVLEELKVSELLSAFVKTMDFYYTDEDSLGVDMFVAVEDYIPDSFKTLTPTGKLSIKTYTKTDYYDITQQFVSGLILRMMGNLFQILPIADVLINFYDLKTHELSQRNEQNLIFSGFFRREKFEEIENFDGNPFETLTEFPCEVKFVKTRGFKPISPLDEMFHR